MPAVIRVLISIYTDHHACCCKMMCKFLQSQNLTFRFLKSSKCCWVFALAGLVGFGPVLQWWGLRHCSDSDYEYWDCIWTQCKFKLNTQAHEWARIYWIYQSAVIETRTFEVVTVDSKNFHDEFPLQSLQQFLCGSIGIGDYEERQTSWILTVTVNANKEVTGKVN